jgi:hypothetical protein
LWSSNARVREPRQLVEVGVELLQRATLLDGGRQVMEEVAGDI